MMTKIKMTDVRIPDDSSLTPLESRSGSTDPILLLSCNLMPLSFMQSNDAKGKEIRESGGLTCASRILDKDEGDGVAAKMAPTGRAAGSDDQHLLGSGSLAPKHWKQ